MFAGVWAGGWGYQQDFGIISRYPGTSAAFPIYQQISRNISSHPTSARPVILLVLQLKLRLLDRLHYILQRFQVHRRGVLAHELRLR